VEVTMNALAHFAINADDLDRARRFYEKALGWRFTPWGPPGFYQLDAGPGAKVLGALQQRRELVAGRRTNAFECTIGVASIDAVEKGALAAGGRIVLPRSVIGGVGTLTFFEDPEGNVFGAMQYDRAAE
jgi:predicted enzyme related to lactoylglutathione lyase